MWPIWILWFATFLFYAGRVLAAPVGNLKKRVQARLKRGKQKKIRRQRASNLKTKKKRPVVLAKRLLQGIKGFGRRRKNGRGKANEEESFVPDPNFKPPVFSKNFKALVSEYGAPKYRNLHGQGSSTAVFIMLDKVPEDLVTTYTASRVVEALYERAAKGEELRDEAAVDSLRRALGGEAAVKKAVSDKIEDIAKKRQTAEDVKHRALAMAYDPLVLANYDSTAVAKALIALAKEGDAGKEAGVAAPTELLEDVSRFQTAVAVALGPITKDAGTSDEAFYASSRVIQMPYDPFVLKDYGPTAVAKALFDIAKEGGETPIDADQGTKEEMNTKKALAMLKGGIAAEDAMAIAD